MKTVIYGVIYLVRNKINNKKYVGQTVNDFNTRYSNNFFKRTCNTHIKNSINKYGKDNFEILETIDIAFSKDELDIKEQCWISIYNTTDTRFGYNKKDGGANGKLTEETKEKMRENSAKYWQGKTLSDEHRKNIGDGERGEKNPNYGKQLSEEQKKKIKDNHADFNGEKHPMFGRSHSEESKIQMSKSHKYNNPRKRDVICVTTGKVFNSAKEGSLYYNTDASGITKCCKGKKQCNGRLSNNTLLQWMYHDEYLQSGFVWEKSKDYRVICITTDKVFNSIKDGSEYYGCHESSIVSCCKGNLKSAGKLNGEKLIWRYYAECSDNSLTI